MSSVTRARLLVKAALVIYGGVTVDKVMLLFYGFIWGGVTVCVVISLVMAVIAPDFRPW